MQKIQVLTKNGVYLPLKQLKTSELENFAREISMLITQRKTKNKKDREFELLRKLNEECVLPDTNLELFYFLNEKKNKLKLTDSEQQKFSQLIREEETLRLKRVRILGELAQLRSITIDQLIHELGIKPSENA